MFSFKRSFSNFSATSAMTAAAAGIFVGVVAPLAGGLPKPYEVQEFRSSFAALINGEASAASGPAFYPHRNVVDLVPVVASHERAEVQPASLPEPLTLDGEVIEVAALPEATTILEGEVVPVAQTLTAEETWCADDCDEGFVIEAPLADQTYDLEEIDAKDVDGVPS
jgi:hypothetical protein